MTAADSNPIVGFSITGPVDLNGAATGLNCSDLVCLSGDGGTNTTGDFFGDLTGCNASVVITSATVGGNSSLTIS